MIKSVRAGCQMAMSSPKSPPKKRIQTAEHAEHAEKWNTSACFAFSAVFSPFYFGDVVESSAFRPSCRGQPPLSEDLGPAFQVKSFNSSSQRLQHFLCMLRR